MPLLLIPLLLLVFILLWALLLPLSLFQRYRSGTARRRLRPWALRINSGLLTLSIVVLLAGAWISGHWVHAALAHASGGLALGLVLGLLGLRLARIESGPAGVHYTPNRWLVLGVMTVVAARIVLGLIHAWFLWRQDAAGVWLGQQGSLLGVGGLLLGYYVSIAWGLLRRARIVLPRAP
ncbi:MAG: DUF1453 domain-containing protein [Pseudomonadota bacterium]|nr:DUF1453 domain-containing protein [Pseudomonadota bacterium]